MVRIAGLQFAGNADREANVRTATRMVRQAADRRAQIVCLPELFSTMYFCVEARREYFDWAEPIPGPTTDRLAAVARETGTVIVCPVFATPGGARSGRRTRRAPLPVPPLTGRPASAG